MAAALNGVTLAFAPGLHEGGVTHIVLHQQCDGPKVKLSVRSRTH